jgi:hypothetical protein
VFDEGKKDLENLGGLAKQTAGVILRELINFAAAGGEEFFGEPEFDVHDLLRTTDDGMGVITSAGAARCTRQAGPVLDLPDVAAGRAVRGHARGG